MDQEAAIQTTEFHYESNPFKLVKPSFEITRRIIGKLIGAFLLPLGLFAVGAGVTFGLAGAVGALFGSQVATVFGVLLAIVGVAYLIVYTIPLTQLVLLKGVKREDINLIELLKAGPRYAWPIVLAGILAGLATLFGFLLLVVPGLIFLAWFSLATIAIIDENLRGVEALKRSKQLVQGRVVEMLALLSVASWAFIPSIDPILDVVIALAGVVFSIIYAPALFLRYFQLKELKGKNQPQPETHWINYAIVAVSLLVFLQQASMSIQEYQQQMQNQDVQTEVSLNI